MFDQLIDIIKEDKRNWDKFQNYFTEREIAPKTVLLSEGEIANNIYFVKNGCLRQWFNKDGKDITFQFFFENQPVASIDSFVNNDPSQFSIESIEPSVILVIRKKDFEEIYNSNEKFKDTFQNHIFQRFSNYSKLFLSRIKDTPQERYADLLRNYPEIIKRIPQHYIASYLGITSVSLSRIRNRK